LHKFAVGISLGQRSHVLKIPSSESRHSGECPAEVGSEAIDDLSAPSFGLLSDEDVATDAPVKEDQFPIYS
jgi:hypothetical protein